MGVSGKREIVRRRMRRRRAEEKRRDRSYEQRGKHQQSKNIQNPFFHIHHAPNSALQRASISRIGS